MHHDLDTRRHQNPIQLSRELIHNKYYDTFNFYFSKPINEILFNARLPHVILLKDFSYFDDETEYFKRYYKQSEAKPRLENITNFYFTLTEGEIKLTLPLHAQNEIILKRNEKLNKLLLSKLQSLAEATAAQGENNPVPDVNNVLDGQGGADQEELKQDENEKKKTQNQQIEKVLNNSQDMLDIKEHLMKRSNSIAKENPAHPSFHKMLPNNMDLPQEVSYDSIRHDIYNPAFSIDESFKENQVPSANNSKKNVQTKRREIISDVFLQATNWNIFESSSNPPQTLLFQTEKRPEIPPVTNTNVIKSDYSSESSPDEPLVSFEGGIQEVKHSEPNKEGEHKQEYRLSSSVSFAKKDGPSNYQSESQSFNEKSQSLIKDSDALHPKADALSNTKHSTVPFKELDLDRTPELISQNHKNSREEPAVPERHESSTTHIHIAEENASRDIKYPIITIKNIQINKINSTAGQSNQPNEIPPSIVAPVYQSVPAKRPIQPQYELKQHLEGHFKLAEPSFTEGSNESAQREAEGSNRKADYMKDLMKRHYGLPGDDSNSQSQPMSERFKESSILAKLARINQKGDGQIQTSRPTYNHTNVRSNLRNEGSKYQKTRSNADAALVQGIQALRGHHGPQNSMSNFNGSTTARTQDSPSSNNRKPHTRLKSNEGLYFPQETSNGQIASNLKQTDYSKLVATELGTIETIQELSGNSENTKTLEKKRAEYKHHNKSKSISSNLFGSQNSSKPNLEIGLNARNHPLNSQPTSVSNKQNFKLDLGVVNSFAKPDSTQGLFSSKSARSSERDLQQYFSKNSLDKNTPRIYQDLYLQSQSNQVEDFKQTIYEKPNSILKPDLAINNRPKRDLITQKPATSQLSTRQAYISSLKNSVRSYTKAGKSVEKKNSVIFPNRINFYT